jgi:hypothetical protein
MIQLKQSLKSTQIPEPISDRIYSLEGLTDEAALTISEEGLMGSIKKTQETFKEQLIGLLKGQESVQEYFVNKLIQMKETATKLDRSHTTKTTLSPIASVFYDPIKNNYRLPIERAITEDVKWIETIESVLESIDGALDANTRLYTNAPITQGKAAFATYWQDRARSKIQSAGLIMQRHKNLEHGLMNSYLAMAKGFNPTAQGDLLLSQSHPITLSAGGIHLPSQAKKQRSEPLTFSQRDCVQYFDRAIAFAKATQTNQKNYEYYWKKYNGYAYLDELIQFEEKAIRELGLMYIKKHISLFVPANVSLLKTMETVPKAFFKRNVSVLKTLIRFGETLF